MYRAFSTSVRIGDVEREAAVSALNRHFAEGRLTLLEHDERISLALAAQHSGDLDKLFADLPALGAQASPRGVGRQGPGAAAGRFIARRVVPIPVMLLGFVIALVVFVHLLPFIIAGAVVMFFVRGRVRRHYCAGGPSGWAGRPFSSDGSSYGHDRGSHRSHGW